MNSFSYKLLLPVAFIVSMLGVTAAFANWTAPPTTPPACPASEPACNVPLNVSAIAQSKLNGLVLNTGNYITGLLVPFGNNSFGSNSSPDRLLHLGNTLATTRFPAVELVIRKHSGRTTGGDATGIEFQTATQSGAIGYSDIGGLVLGVGNTGGTSSKRGLVVSNAGNVGVGFWPWDNSVPSYLFEVKGNSQLTGNLYIKSSTAPTPMRLWHNASATANYGLQIANGATAVAQFGPTGAIQFPLLTQDTGVNPRVITSTAGGSLAWRNIADLVSGGTTYTQGTGIFVNNTTKVISADNTKNLWNANQLQTRTVSATAPASGQVLKWNGTAWAPGTDLQGTTGTTYSASTGLSLAGTIFSARVAEALWNANKLQGNTVSSGLPATGQVLKWTGSTWAPGTDNTGAGGGVSQIVAGTGVTISPTAGTGVVTISSTATGGGEINTASNLGALGTGIFKEKIGVDLKFKKLRADTGINLIVGYDDIGIKNTGITSVTAGTGITVATNNGVATISSSGSSVTPGPAVYECPKIDVTAPVNDTGNGPPTPTGSAGEVCISQCVGQLQTGSTCKIWKYYSNPDNTCPYISSNQNCTLKGNLVL
ncbi:MAG: hypothetical protein A2589_01095 [Candidatus Vogelbacteria bacterium RIFOXYD1_FULL_46_19]|uniref:Uncharacterized protein n=1 Tax=Candidatus Vogelbacteria bacterium RIFOXYD1_FULL_46_19 TaxID=1802439 RepID=A0A1G2QFP8_9BACT|nr:MAG: hypothetical protein A2589_01095 [Candidatus Vogelbacteria bacterium RIFOXYD1_FULL_46_19]